MYVFKSPNTNPQAVNFQRCKCAFTCSITCQFTRLASVVCPLQSVVLLCNLQQCTNCYVEYSSAGSLFQVQVGQKQA